MKSLLVTVLIALRALRRNTLRSLLTMLGIVIGVSAVIAMVSIGTGARVQMEQQVAGLGQNVILVMSGNVRSGGVFSGFGGAGTLTVADADAIRSQVEGAAVVSPEVRGSAQLIVGNLNWNSQVLGANHDYLELRQWPLAEGEFFSAQDIRANSRVAVLGQSVANKLFSGENPVGQAIRVKGVPFTVVDKFE